MADLIPYPDLTRRYVELKRANSEERLRRAEGATVAEYAHLICESVAAFERFDVSPDEPFFPESATRDQNKNPKQADRTFGWAMAFKAATEPIVVSGDSDLTLSYVAREVAPTHTKPARTFEHVDGRRNSTDLILRNAATGRPVVAELKIGRDKDPFTALVQALAAAAQLVPKSQRARLCALDSGLASFEHDPRMDVLVLIADFPSRNKHRWYQLAYAHGLACGLSQHPDVRRYFGRVDFLQLRRDGQGGLSATTALPDPHSS